jgi:Ankyrin repeat
VKFLLLQERIDPNKLSAGRHNVLMMTNGNVVMLKLQLDCERVKQICPSEQQPRRSSFHIAASSGDCKMIKAMLYHDRIDPNILTARGRHALMLANRPEVMHVLVTNKRISPNLCDSSEYSLFQVLNDLAMLACLLKEERVDLHLLTSNGLNCVNLAKTDKMRRLVFGNYRVISNFVDDYQADYRRQHPLTKPIA